MLKFDHSYIKTSDKFYKPASAKNFKNPAVVLFNADLARTIDLEYEKIDAFQLSLLLCGNKLFPGSEPCALIYAGHQFGHFVPTLGDGRALLLGEVISKNGERFDLQLKGSGPTYFSRRGDGLAALGPMIREYVISEAMHALGVKTTRSLSVVTTGEYVLRHFMAPGAVLARVAASHIRVGTFEYFYKQKDFATLKILTDYTIKRHYQELENFDKNTVPFLQAFMTRQIDLICDWMRIGFVHGVMNTDNCALSGETLDFGPCAFLDEYRHDKCFSSIDINGRYSFSAQTGIALWNFTRLAECLSFLISTEEFTAKETINSLQIQFEKEFNAKYLQMMCHKIGLFNVQTGDSRLITELLAIMEDEGLDYTLTFRSLMNVLDPVKCSYCHLIDFSSVFQNWLQIWKNRLKNQAQDLVVVIDLMLRHNPAAIPRNHILESVIIAAERNNDFTGVHEFMRALSSPYAYNSEFKKYYQSPKTEERVCQTFCGT